MSTNPRIDHRKLPRRKRAPSPRDQAIYALRHLQGCSQAELAKEHGLSQVRISQILHRVEKWRANLRPQEYGQLSHDERRRLDHWLVRQLHEGIYARAIRGFDAAPKELTTTKDGDRDGKPFHEQTRREQPAAVQLLKVAQRAVEQLSREADKPAPPGVKDPEWDEELADGEMRRRLVKLRWEAEQAGKVPASREHRGDNFDSVSLVEFWLAALVGDEQADLPREEHVQEGESLQALLEFYPQQLARRKREVAEWVAAQQAQDDASNSFSASNPAADESAQVQELPEVPPQTVAEKTAPDAAAGDDTAGGQSASSHPAPLETDAQRREREAAEKAERRRLHLEKIEQWKMAQRRGLPCMFEFDPADGPPPPVYYRLDGSTDFE